MSPDDPRPGDVHGQRTPGWWGTVAITVIGVAYLAVAAVGVQPYRAPAGHGAVVASDTTGGEGGVLATRPPTPDDATSLGAAIVRIVPGSPAEKAGLHVGDRIQAAEQTASDLRDAGSLLRDWRAAYWQGVSGAVAVRVRDGSGQSRAVTLERPAAWTLSGDALAEWLGLRGGVLVALAMFILGGVALLLLRPRAATAQFAIVALVLCGISTGGPLLGAEQSLGWLPARVLTMASWLATPMAFPAITLAIAYFPRRSPLLDRYPALHAVPFVVASPIILTAALTGLFVCGVDGLIGAARWDASHASLFFGNFAIGLLLNATVVAEMVSRFRRMSDPADRRRITLAIATTVIAMATYLIQAGAPAVSLIATGRSFIWPWWVALPLNVLAALPAVGLTYAVAVHRVLSPRNVVRQSLQYALAKRTLAFAAVLPALLLVISLVAKRHESLSDIVAGQPLLDATLLGAVLVAFKYRLKTMQWLDRRFFRAEYDAREVLLTLAGRIPYETDPNELTWLVLHWIDHALHPSVAAVLASGVEPGTLVPISVLHGTVEKLSQTGPLASMLTWSDQPLDLDLNDTRSPARRLPPDETKWVSASGAALLVPLIGREQDTPLLVGALVLGPKRSEEPYTAEDRELLSSIAAQVSLGLDVARLRRRAAPAAEGLTIVTPTSVAESPVAECPTCRVCYDAGTIVCESDHTPLRAGAVPRTIDAKYRVDRVLGTGGMGAVYLAHDMRLDRDVAIKVVRADLLTNPDARARFRREAQLVARLQHPGVVSVFDYGTLPGGAAFLVMEFVKGRDLRSIVKEGPQPPAFVARLLASIAEPIDAAHQLGILHRDLKPENILLPDAGVVTAKVLDFGIAKAVSASTDVEETRVGVATLTAEGQPIGTPAYMAPEQLAGGTVSERTDVYAIGVIGYELLTGELPFGRGSFVDVALRQVERAPDLVRNDVPEVLKQTITAALSPDPRQRPATAGALASALRQLPA